MFLKSLSLACLIFVLASVNAAFGETDVQQSQLVVGACYFHSRIVSGSRILAPKEDFQEPTRQATDELVRLYIEAMSAKGFVVETKACPKEGVDDDPRTSVVFSFLVYPYVWGPEKIAVVARAKVAGKYIAIQEGKLPWLGSTGASEIVVGLAVATIKAVRVPAVVATAVGE